MSFEALIKAGADVNKVNRWRVVVVDGAALARHRTKRSAARAAMAHVCSQYGARVWTGLDSMLCIDGRASIHWAAGQGHSSTVELLIANNADVNAQDK